MIRWPVGGVAGWLIKQQRWVAAGLLLSFFVLGLAGVRDKNATFDEVAHLPAGYSYLALRDFRMSPSHPPLAKLVAALPLLAMQPALDREDAAWRKGSEWLFGQQFLFTWNAPDRLIFWGRLPLLLLATLFGLVVMAAGRQLYGPLAGLLALTLYGFTPEFLAHGPLVATDFMVTAALFAAIFCFYRALLIPSLSRLLLLAAAAGVCVTAKFSGVLIGPMLLLLGAVYLVCPVGTPLTTDLVSGPRCLASRRERFQRLLLLAGVVTLGCLLVIWLSYGLRYSIAPDPSVSRRIAWESVGTEGFPARMIMVMRALHLLPESYLFGLLGCLKSIEGRNAFLLGASSTSGWWYYYPVTFALKTPVPLLLLMVLAALRCDRRMIFPTALLLLPAVLYLGVAMAGQTNIGNRHILPVYPFLIVFAAGFGAKLALSGQSWQKVLIALLLLWQMVGVVRVSPDFLAYFNELAGGPAGGYRYLADSNLDWGQDLKGLARYRDAHPGERLLISYFGAADPRYYLRDVEYLPSFFPVREVDPVPFDAVPRGALVAISVTNLNGVNVREHPGAEEFLTRLKALEPEARIGYSIHVYRWL